MQHIRDIIADQVRAIAPFDELEGIHKADTLEWIESGADLFRVAKPDVPRRHLVSYFAVIDPDSNKMLLQDHLLAKVWVPPGGHVDPDEDPIVTVERECQEELGFPAEFHGDRKPHFVTVTQTNGQNEHIDTSLWYVLQASETTPLTIEPDKFAGVRWWPMNEILATPITRFDPHLHRFVHKLAKGAAI